MDLGEKEKRAIDSLNLASAEWNQTSMVDSFIWNQPMCWNPSDSLSKGGMFLSAGQGLSQFSCDTGFTEKASRNSSLNRSALVDPVKEKREKASIDFSEPEFSEDGREESPNSSVFGTNKRKRSCKIMELDRQQATLQLPLEIAKEEKNSAAMENAPKEDYIHVRARRGQATNSHSLAERVRREKISERMKFLQDLVPGCSKVTGKAVMLDEIINYVQSLQRQVEFLSMKLAAVNPSTDFNIESIISKDLFQNRFGSSSAVGFAPEMIRQQLQRPPHQGLIQVGIPGVMNPSDAFRRALHAQLPSASEYKEAAQQVCNDWDEDLHNVVQMTYGNNPPHKTQDLNGVPRDGFPL